jgi:hypothetical protein
MGQHNDRFETHFWDLYIRREWYITQDPVEYEDVGFFHDMLLEISSEWRRYIINVSTLIVEAAKQLEDI